MLFLFGLKVLVFACGFDYWFMHNALEFMICSSFTFACGNWMICFAFRSLILSCSCTFDIVFGSFVCCFAFTIACTTDVLHVVFASLLSALHC